MTEPTFTLAECCKAAMERSGQPTGWNCGKPATTCGTDDPCEICNGTGGIASASRCPECEP